MQFDADTIQSRLEAKAYLHGGLVLVFSDQATAETTTFLHPNGIADYLPKLVADRGKPVTHPARFT